MKPVSNFEQVGFFIRTADPKNPANNCQCCPANGPKQRLSVASPSTLGCTGCSTWESEYVFIFGNCRQFFGEPTHRWLSGK